MFGKFSKEDREQYIERIYRLNMNLNRLVFVGLALPITCPLRSCARN